MSTGVEFEEDKIGLSKKQQFANNSINNSYSQVGFGGWLIRNGWAKSSGGAQIIQVIIVIINIIITYIVITRFL